MPEDSTLDRMAQRIRQLEAEVLALKKKEKVLLQQLGRRSGEKIIAAGPGETPPAAPIFFQRNRQERTLLENKETALALLNASADRALLLDVAGRVLALNRTAADALGCPVEDLIGRNVFERFDREVSKRRKAYHDRVVKTCRSVQYEDTREGRWLETRLYPVFDAAGRVIRVATFSRDVTEYRQALEEVERHRRHLQELVAEKTAQLIETNKALKAEVNACELAEKKALREKRYLESLITHSPLGIVVVDESHRIRSCNRAFESLFGYRESELIGKGLDPLIARDRYMNEAAVFTRNTISGTPIHGTGQRYRKDRRIIDVEFFGVPVIIDGAVTGAYGIYQDISGLKEAERKLQKSEERSRHLYEEAKRAEEVYRSLIHSSADAVVIYDLSGRVRYVSPAFTHLFGWTQEELEGKRIPFLPESEKEKTMAVIRDLLENGTPCQGYETRRFTKSGELLEISISASRYNDHEGRPAGMLVMLRNISERKELEAKLLQAHKMEAIGTLAGGVAHDFNNILHAISGYTQLLMSGKSPGDGDYEKLKAIETSAERAGKLTRQLLIFGRKVESQLRPVDLNNEVRQVSSLLERTIPRMINIRMNLAPDIGIINADPVQLEQIMMNLGVNARDAMPQGGDLTFETRNRILDEDFSRAHPGCRPGDYVLLKISDTGHGMDRKTVEHIFEPFFTTKETGKGTGLGLAMVYGIVKSHGGYIICESAPGRGTTFRIYFPALEATVPEPPETEDGEAVPGGNETILIVDDDTHVLDIAREMLKALDYTILTAGSGEKALSVYIAHKDRVRLVILDLNMPGMGGEQCLRELLTITPQLKVIVATGYSVTETEKKLLYSGASAFVGKPYRLKEMARIIREVLDSR